MPVFGLLLGVSAVMVASCTEDRRAPQVAMAPAPVEAPRTTETINTAERDCLAEAIYFEARGEPREGKLAIAHVVMNRAASTGHPSEVCGVIREGEERGRGQCQFSWRCDGLVDKPRDMTAWADAQAVATKVLEGQTQDPTNGALFFHAEKVSPEWASKLRRTAAIGAHIYYAK